MRVKTTLGLAIAGVAAAGAAAIGGTAWAAAGTGDAPAGPAAPVVSEQETAAPGDGARDRDRDCPEKNGGQAPGGSEAAAAETL